MGLNIEPLNPEVQASLHTWKTLPTADTWEGVWRTWNQIITHQHDQEAHESFDALCTEVIEHLRQHPESIHWSYPAWLYFPWSTLNPIHARWVQSWEQALKPYLRSIHQIGLVALLRIRPTLVYLEESLFEDLNQSECPELHDDAWAMLNHPRGRQILSIWQGRLSMISAGHPHLARHLMSAIHRHQTAFELSIPFINHKTYWLLPQLLYSQDVSFFRNVIEQSVPACLSEQDLTTLFNRLCLWYDIKTGHAPLLEELMHRLWQRFPELEAGFCPYDCSIEATFEEKWPWMQAHQKWVLKSMGYPHIIPYLLCAPSMKGWMEHPEWLEELFKHHHRLQKDQTLEDCAWYRVFQVFRDHRHLQALLSHHHIQKDREDSGKARL